jgi:hypothetical protein
MHDDRDDPGPPGSSQSPKTRAAEPRNATPDQRPHPAPPTRTSSKSHTSPTNVDTYKTDKMATNDEHGLSTLARKAFAKNETSSSHHPHLAPTTRACSWPRDHESISLTKDTNKTDRFSQLGHNGPPSMMTESESPDSSRTQLSTFTVQGHPDYATHEGIQAVTVSRDDGPDHHTRKGTLIVTEPHNLPSGDPPPHPPGFPVSEPYHSLSPPHPNKAHDTVQGHPDFASHEGTQADVTVPRDDGPVHHTRKGSLIIAEPHYWRSGGLPPPPTGFPSARIIP